MASPKEEDTGLIKQREIETPKSPEKISPEEESNCNPVTFANIEDEDVVESVDKAEESVTDKLDIHLPH